MTFNLNEKKLAICFFGLLIILLLISSITILFNGTKIKREYVIENATIQEIYYCEYRGEQKQYAFSYTYRDKEKNKTIPGQTFYYSVDAEQELVVGDVVSVTKKDSNLFNIILGVIGLFLTTVPVCFLLLFIFPLKKKEQKLDPNYNPLETK